MSETDQATGDIGIALSEGAERKSPLEQIAEAMCDVVGGRLEMLPDGTGFRLEPIDTPPGQVGTVRGLRLPGGDRPVVEVQFEVGHVQGADGLLEVWDALAEADVALCPTRDSSRVPGGTTMAVKLRVVAEDMDAGDIAALHGAVKRVRGIARRLQPYGPRELQAQSTAPEWADAPGLALVEAVRWEERLGPEQARAVRDWADGVISYLSAGCVVCVEAECALVERLLASSLAWRVQTQLGRFCARLERPVDGAAVTPLAQRIGNDVALIPLRQLGFMDHRHEATRQAASFIEACEARGLRAVLVGTPAEGSRIAGQGSQHDALRPVMVQAPTLSLSLLVAEGLRAGCGEHEHVDAAAAALVAAFEQTGGWEPRHVEYATNHVAARVTENVEADWSALATEAVALVKAPRRALGAGGGGHPSSRPEHLQRQWVQAVCAPSVASDMRACIKGQDAALDQLLLHLQREILSGERHLPISCALLGPVGVGKTETARTIARVLGAEYLRIDCPSLGDAYAARSTLLGTSSGLVGSHAPGLLERACSTFGGTVVEVSDPEWGGNDVLGLLLRILDEGTFLTGNGTVRSAAGFVFLMSSNIGHRSTDKAPIGFGPGDGHCRQAEEMKLTLSDPLVSRLGAPVVFGHLSPQSLAEIAASAVATAVGEGLVADTPDARRPEVVTDDQVGAWLAGQMRGGRSARDVKAVARDAAILALLDLRRNRPQALGHSRYTVQLLRDERIVITPHGMEHESW